jgi:putative transposase
VLDRTFEAPAPNRKWIADFTYVWTAEGWLYRRVAGWSMSAAMTAQLVTDALMMAIWRRGKPDALLHHGIRISGLHHCSRPADIDGCTRSLRRTARILVGSRSTQC